MKAVKFATQIDEKVLEQLRELSSQSNRNISSIVNEAVKQYIQRVKVRPAFREAAEQVIGEHEDLLRRLAK